MISQELTALMPFIILTCGILLVLLAGAVRPGFYLYEVAIAATCGALFWNVALPADAIIPGISINSFSLGDSIVMLTDGGGSWQPMPAVLYLYVPDADATYRRALAAGATSVQEPTTQFYGDRHGGVKDPSGNIWWIATHVEDVSPEEVQARAAAYARQQGPPG
jgi:hypothetical protein